MKKKILSLALVACLIIPCMAMLTACGEKPTLKVNQNVATNTQTIISNLSQNIYNAQSITQNQSKNNYTVSEIQALFTGFEYYVEIGTVENIDDIDSITLGGTKFEDDETFKLSIGNGNYIVDECFYEDNNKIFVAAPIIAFEEINNTEIKINNNKFNFDLDVVATPASFTNVTSTASDISVASASNGFNVTFNGNVAFDQNSQGFLKLTYADATSTDVLLTKKVLTKGSNVEVSYGISGLESDLSLGFYPMGWRTAELAQADVNKYDDATMKYYAVIGNKLISTTLNYNVVLA
ncbi:MAG: hypothetical protein IJZ29_00080 [Clostridia bacterium]|nr:hypothetical protein [Clostridia bacterium]